MHIRITLFTFFKYLADQIAANARIIRVTKVLVDSLLERIYTLTDFLGVVGMYKFLEDGS